MMTKLMPVIVYGILGAVLLLAAFFFFLGARNVWRGLVSPHWPSADGTVVTSDLARTTSVDSDTDQREVDYGATISFRYTVKGRDYTTSLLYFGQSVSSGDPTEAQLRHLRYPKGAEVPIFYNPSDPTIAAAETGFHSESLLLIIAGLLFGLPCIIAGVTCSDMFSTGTANADPLGMATSTVMTIGASIFASIFAMAGIGALSLGLINLSRGYASEHWPTAPGVITYQTLDASDAGQGTSTYASHLVFAYEVDGKKRYSNLRRFGLLAGGAAPAAEKAHDQYPEGKAVTVAYSPDNPNLGVLEPGIDREALILPGIGVVVLLFALAVFVFAIPQLAQIP